MGGAAAKLQCPYIVRAGLGGLCDFVCTGNLCKVVTPPGSVGCRGIGVWGAVFERSGGEGLLHLGFKSLTGGGGIGVAACREVVFNDVLLGAEKTFGAGGFEVPCGGNFLIRRNADFAAFVC